MPKNIGLGKPSKEPQHSAWPCSDQEKVIYVWTKQRRNKQDSMQAMPICHATAS